MKNVTYYVPHMKQRKGFEAERDFVYRVWSKTDPSGSLKESPQRYQTRQSAAAAGHALMLTLPGGLSEWRMHAFSPQWPQDTHNPHNFDWPPLPSED